MKAQRSRRTDGFATPSPSDFCEFFPPEFRTACDPYCWACGPDRAAHDEAAHHDRAHHHHGAALEVGHDPEDVDSHPYFWDLKEEICPCHP